MKIVCKQLNWSVTEAELKSSMEVDENNNNNDSKKFYSVNNDLKNKLDSTVNDHDNKFINDS